MVVKEDGSTAFDDVIFFDHQVIVCFGGGGG
jgi:hypothetical protein